MIIITGLKKGADLMFDSNPFILEKISEREFEKRWILLLDQVFETIIKRAVVY